MSKLDLRNQGLTKTQGIENPKRQPKEILKKRLYTVEEAAVYMGRTVDSLRELIWADVLPIVRIGRRIHLDIIDLDKAIEQYKTRYTF